MKYILYEDVSNPTLAGISREYGANFIGLDFTKVGCIRFMKEVIKVNDALIIPPMYNRFEIYPLNTLPKTPNNYITHTELWDFKKDLKQSPIIKAN